METNVGIEEYLYADADTVSCVFKAKYSDFHVWEIDSGGVVVEATDPLPLSSESTWKKKTEVPVVEVLDCDSMDWTELMQHVSIESVEELKTMVKQKISDGHVILGPFDDKGKRTLIHTALRTLGGLFGSETIDGGYIKVGFLTEKQRKRQKKACNPAFLLFYLYKQNRNTMDAFQKLSFLLRKPSKCFSYAGTKDKRAVTTQRAVFNNMPHRDVSVDRLLSLNCVLWKQGIWISNVRSADSTLMLGDLWGNRFDIFLRDFKGDTSIIDTRKRFINYYGMQRFGACRDIMTHHVGLAILKEEWSEAIDLILRPREGEKENVQHGREIWMSTGDADGALRVLPGSMVAERAIFTHFSKHGTQDVLGALQRIPHEMKMMYVHSVQSLFWNQLASERIRIDRQNVVVGDLVWTETGVIGIHTMTEAMKYGLEDVVLPLFGPDVMYPTCASLVSRMDLFVSQMFGTSEKRGSEALSEICARCKVGRLAGSYRKLISAPRDLEYMIMSYASADTIVLRPLLDDAPSCDAAGTIRGLRISFSLPASSYATMALREILRIDTCHNKQSS